MRRLRRVEAVDDSNNGKERDDDTGNNKADWRHYYRLV